MPPKTKTAPTPPADVALVDAVCFAIPGRLPADALETFAPGMWQPLEAHAAHVDDSGQQWASVRMPIGEPAPRRVEREDGVHAVAVVRLGQEAAVLRLVLSPEDAEQYTVEARTPDLKMIAHEHAVRMLEEILR